VDAASGFNTSSRGEPSQCYGAVAQQPKQSKRIALKICCRKYHQMAEPIPSANENAEDQQPTNAEDRKAAAVLDALNAHVMSQGNGEAPGTKQPTAVDQDALMKAMGRLEAVAGAGSKGGSKKSEEKKAAVKKEAEVKKKIKVSQEDVQFLVAELDLSKTKATELLKAHDGGLDAAVKSFIQPAVKA